MRDRLVWLLRLLWFALPVSAGPTLVRPLEGCDDSYRLALTVGLWLVWAAGLLCAAIPLPVTLTGIRALAPGLAAAVVGAVVDSGADGWALAAIVIAIAVAVVAFSPHVGDRMVDGASYGDERRMLLRPPTRLAVLVVPITWSIAAVGAIGGPLLLAAGNWPAGTAVTLVGLAVSAVAVRALHQLSRRWIVFVPTGFVLHDLHVLTEPVLFRRTAIERLGPAIEGTPARDLTSRAAGLLIECELTDPAPLGLRLPSGSHGHVAQLDVRRFLFAPSLPGALLDEAERRRIPVG